MSNHRDTLRTNFEKESQLPWINHQEEPDIDYVYYLEDRVPTEETLNWLFDTLNNKVNATFARETLKNFKVRLNLTK